LEWRFGASGVNLGPTRWRVRSSAGSQCEVWRLQ
jgi:hypothetical protein